MLTSGSYVDERTERRSALLITVADVGAAIVTGLVICPILFSFGLEPTLGTELAFATDSARSTRPSATSSRSPCWSVSAPERSASPVPPGGSSSTGPTTTCPPSVLGHLLEFQFHFEY